MADKEVWRPIPGYKGYEASDQGRIRSIDRWVNYKNDRKPRFWKGKILNFNLSVHGYRLVSLSKAWKSARVHQLVALAFFGPRPKNLVVRHLDGNRINNRSINLAYGTRREDCEDKIRHGTANRGEKQGLAKLTKGKVRYIRTSNLSNTKLGLKLGVHRVTVSDARTGRTWGWLDVEDSQTDPRMGHRNC